MLYFPSLLELLRLFGRLIIFGGFYIITYGLTGGLTGSAVVSENVQINETLESGIISNEYSSNLMFGGTSSNCRLIHVDQLLLSILAEPHLVTKFSSTAHLR